MAMFQLLMCMCVRHSVLDSSSSMNAVQIVLNMTRWRVSEHRVHRLQSHSVRDFSVLTQRNTVNYL